MNSHCPGTCHESLPLSTGDRLATPPSSSPTPVPATSTARRRAAAPLWLVLAAFAAVYLIWGSTYLGIRLAIDSLPPFLMAGSRFLLAGALLYGFMRWKGAPRPGWAEWRSAAIIGALLLLAGNGGVTWAEQTTPTGLTALIIAATPLWILLADWARPGGRAPGVVTVLGLVIGFFGVSLIVFSRSDEGVRLVPSFSALVLLASTVCWASGSIYARHAAKPASALLGIAMQMVAGGVALMLAGLVAGEAARFDPGAVTAASVWAWVYLCLIGSLVGFTAYVWLLEVSTPARVSTYAYVNPIVAVLLGKLVLDEPVPHRVALAGVLVLVAVVLISRRAGAARGR